MGFGRHLVRAVLVFAAVVACIPSRHKVNAPAIDAEPVAAVPSFPTTIGKDNGTSAGKNIARLNAKDSQVWDAMLDILLSNYQMHIVDQANGLISTDWDTYYVKDQLYRNKLSIRIKRVNWGQTDIALINKVEKLLDGSNGSQFLATWVPSEDSLNEKSRILSNLKTMVDQGSDK